MLAYQYDTYNQTLCVDDELEIDLWKMETLQKK